MSGKILLLNGPNLNMLGKREPEIYGHDTLEDVVALVTAEAAKHGLEVEALQSNHEGELIDALHKARGTHIGCVLNPAGLTHTSVALLDAVKASELPTVEVHISNPHAREEFRHHSFISLAAVSVIAGAGIQGYRYAVDILANL
ncbi:3-dehydroquinate dehydratase [Corynebacterium suranareeae]|uniref:3-dehydroquinate dehydratase n=1 Tax=Corynebacterium suranareeae TaxID=2506452 RepID=A0A160PN90_9CORY|nr:type II 3-dehydroquinate dehydratase [Corynebacterium suranareeae]BAU94824.1 3-dehydroquinate dehydratase [Corynebacterium suranareeae]